MVRLVPPFLRNFIGSSEEPTSSEPLKPDDTDQKSIDYGQYPDLTFQKQYDRGQKIDHTTPKFGLDLPSEPHSTNCTTALPIDASDSISHEQLKSLEVTSNIATIASIDWGPPKLNPNVLDELGNSGRYLFDMLRGNKLTFENPELLKKNIKNVPKVYESDFSVYLDQMTKIESTDLNILGDSMSESDSNLKVLDNDKVSIEYFEDNYSLNDNSIFNNDLESIPNSIEFLESQLMVINNQLRELVSTHLKHVGESFVCIQDLKDSYVDINHELTNVRSIFNNLKGIYHSPVDYHSFKISKLNSRYSKQRFNRENSNEYSANISDTTTNNTNSASASGDFLSAPLNSLKNSSSNLEKGSDDDNAFLSKKLFELKHSDSCTLHEVLLIKRKVIDVLEFIITLRGVVFTPEYIQALVSNDMALARIFAYCAHEYFKKDLCKFTLTNSVNLVLKDTIVNLERVAEAKFVDLCYYALTQCYTNEGGVHHRCNTNSINNNQLSNVTSSINSNNNITNRSSSSSDNSDMSDFTRDSLFETNLRGTLEKMEPVLIVLTISDMLDEIFDTLQSTKISPINFKSTISVQEFEKNLSFIFTGFKNSNLFLLHLLECVKSVYIQNQSESYLPDPERAIKIVKKLIFNIQNSFPDGINRDYQKLEETTQLLKNELNLSTSFKFQEYNYYWSYYSIDNSEDESNFDISHKKATNNSAINADEHVDMSNIYNKLVFTIKNIFIKSLESLFNKLQINDQSSSNLNDIFNEMEKTMSTIKIIEDEYKKCVKSSVKCLDITNQLCSSVIVHKNEVNEKTSVNGSITQKSENESYANINDKSTSIEQKLMKIFNNFVNTQVRKQVEVLFEQSLVDVHENLNKEKWENFKKIKLEEREFNLIDSSVALSEHLDIYFSISEKFPFLNSVTLSKSINLFAYFNTLIENELEKNLSVKKLCLIIQTLDYFAILIPVKIKLISALNTSGYLSTGSSPTVSDKYGSVTPANEFSDEKPTINNSFNNNSDTNEFIDKNKIGDGTDDVNRNINLKKNNNQSTHTISDSTHNNNNSDSTNNLPPSADNSTTSPSNPVSIDDDSPAPSTPVRNDSNCLDANIVKDYDKLLVIGINAENCVMESKLLRNKSANLLSNFIFSQIKMYLINWVFKYTDLQESDSLSQEGTDEVDLVIETIENLYTECSEFCTVEDLKATFGDSFEKLVDLLRKQNVELSGLNKFSDDCTRIITSLSHLTDIKLEILSLAHGLSS